MSIVFSAIVPHSPLLIPAIGKQNASRLKTTLMSYEKLEHDLYASQADTILIISPHGPIQLEYFTMNLSPEFYGKFEEFGDFSTKITISGNVGLAYRMRERMETRAPLQLVTNANLDYGAAVPLFLLTRHLPKIKIIPLYYCGLDLQSHYNFGQLLKRELLVNKNRVAVIASGDLSHRLTKDAPAGYSVKGKKFDKKLIELLRKNQTRQIISFNQEFTAEAGECGLKSIVILLGILEGIKTQPQLLSYESPFGVGYLTMNYRI